MCSDMVQVLYVCVGLKKNQNSYEFKLLAFTFCEMEEEEEEEEEKEDGRVVCERLPEPQKVRGRKVVPSEFGEVLGVFRSKDLRNAVCVCMILMDKEHATLFKMLRLPAVLPSELERTVKRAALPYKNAAVDLRDERGEEVPCSTFMQLKVGHGFYTAYVTVVRLFEFDDQH